jgi:hypothetical protein
MALKIVEAVQLAFGFKTADKKTEQTLVKKPVELLPWEDDPSCGADVPLVIFKTVMPEPPKLQGGWLGAPPTPVEPAEPPKFKGLIVGGGGGGTKVVFKAKTAPVLPALIPTPNYVPATSPGGSYTILDAIQEVANGRKGTLMLVPLKGGPGYKVEGYDPQTGKTKLVGENGMTFKPKIGMREVPIYSPIWR